MKLTVSHPSHIREGVTINSIMWSKVVILALVSLLAVGMYTRSSITLGLSSLGQVLVSVLSAVLTEAGIQKITKQELTIKDGDAVLMGVCK